MALIVAFPYTGVAFAHTETMKMDEPGSVHPPGVCFTLFFYSLPPAPATSLLFSFFPLLFVFYLPFSLFNNMKNPVQLSHTRPPLPCPAPPRARPGPRSLPPPRTGTRSGAGSELPPGPLPVSAGSFQSNAETHTSDL